MDEDKEKKNKERLAENKLVILYLLNKAGCSLTNLQMLRLLNDFEDFNYYYFQHLLSDLVSQSYVANYQQGEEWLYEITSKGKEILELTENILPGIKKLKLDMIIKDMLYVVQNEVAVTAEYIPESYNNYITRCRIMESHKTIFELSISCTSQEQARKISENWKKYANEYYPEMIKMLTRE